MTGAPCSSQGTSWTRQAPLLSRVYEILYQQGLKYGYANTKAHVLDRDNYTCQHCGGKSKDPRLHVHHLVFRSQQGSDEEGNLLTLCKTCHDGVHAGTVILKQTGKKKGTLKHATQMNSIRVQLLKPVPVAEETFGFITKVQRQAVGLPKAHVFDATTIATRGQAPTFVTTTVLTKRCVPDGDYQQTKGKHREQRIPTGKLGSFRKFDKVRYRGTSISSRDAWLPAMPSSWIFTATRYTSNRSPSLRPCSE